MTVMTINFKGRTRSTATCSHKSQMRIEVAGMSRSVCETCGRVTLGFVDNHFGDWRDNESSKTEA